MAEWYYDALDYIAVSVLYWCLNFADFFSFKCNLYKYIIYKNKHM